MRLVEQRCNKPNSMIGYIRMQRVKIMPTEVPVSGVMEHCFVKGFLATPATFSRGSVSKLMQFANQRGLVNFGDTFSRDYARQRGLSQNHNAFSLETSGDCLERRVEPGILSSRKLLFTATKAQIIVVTNLNLNNLQNLCLDMGNVKEGPLFGDMCLSSFL